MFFVRHPSDGGVPRSAETGHGVDQSRTSLAEPKLDLGRAASVSA